jgi:hypothetical protein
MQDEMISKLFSSFTDLEKAISSARHTLEKRGSISKEILARLDSYYDILDKQRILATALCDHLNKGNWSEVNRHVQLINGLSAMIRDDAKAVLASMVDENDEATQTEPIGYLT